MGLSLKDVEAGAANVGNLLLKGVTKFNEIRQQAVGIVPTPTTASANNTNAATAGTVQQKLQTSGTLDQQVAKAKGSGGLGIVVVIVLLVVVLSSSKG